MKKLFIATLIVSFFAISAQAQTTFGVRAGLNIAKIKAPGDDPDSKIGFHFGGILEYDIASIENFYLQPEVLFSFQGAEDFNTTYLNIPILAKYYVAEQVSLHAGPQFGLLLGAEDEGEEFLTTLDVGIALGGDYHINENIGVGLRYVIGVTDISDSEFIEDWFNRNFMITASYTF